MTEQQPFQILHISDLHIKANNGFDRSVVLDPLIERVEKDRRDADLNPEIVVVTGDIAYQGLEKEYGLAKLFFADLMASLDLGGDKIFIVPGNHDLQRKAYPKSFVPQFEKMSELNDELNHYRNDHLKGHKHYFNFINTHYPHMKTLHDNLIPFVCSHETKCGKRIGLLGLNSAWMSRESATDKGRIAIGEFQVKKGMEALKSLGDHDCRICLFHHPLDFLWTEDKDICRKHLDKLILLSGHLHEPGGGFTSDLDGKFFQFQAGAAYSGSEFPNRFQYITLDWDENLIRLDFRKFEKRKWIPDSVTGDDGSKCFKMFETKKITPKKAPISAPTPPPPLKPPETYFRWIDGNYANMDAERLHGKGLAIPLKLPEIFVRLLAHDPMSKSEGTVGTELGSEEKQKPEDVEKLIVKNGFLLMEGSAGSGKTTLLKHFAWGLAQKINWQSKWHDEWKAIPANRSGTENGPKPIDEARIEGVEDVLPILIYLKDINDYFRDPENKTSETGAEAIMAWYFRVKMASVISIQIANQFINAKKAAIFLDGLDELLPAHRDHVANAFADLRVKRPGVRVVVSGRPHSMEGAVVKRFGDRRVKILPFNMDQIETYINRWFTYLYPGNMGIGARNAQAMIAEVRAHKAIADLSENPLMLTAICILYHDGNELPDQRAELYKKFIDNLLHRRFKKEDAERVHDYLKTLAHKMQMKRVRGVPRSVATDTLKEIYKIKSEETAQETTKETTKETNREYQKRVEALFDDLEPKCGLLKLENGEYLFRHLTFQEFLAAHYIVNNNGGDFEGAIESLWGDNWHNEVIELYIGYLSIENKETANRIVEAAMSTPDASPYKRWMIAARSFQDIPKSKRYGNVLEQTQRRLIEIIDTEADAQNRATAGETLGWIGDSRADLRDFVKIDGGVYDLEDLGGDSKKHEIKEFEIGKYPVVNSWFEEFVEDGGYLKKEVWSPEGWKWLEDRKFIQPRYWDDRKWKCPNSPVVGVSWYEAFAFTQWLTLSRGDGHTYRLLTENEWQAAAAGHGQRKYPWGKGWDKNRCNNKEMKIEKTTPAGLFKTGQTPEGAFDLSGNVWEWTLSDYHSSKESLEDFVFDREVQKLWDKGLTDEFLKKLREETRQLPVLRGGAWFSGSDFCLCARRGYNLPNVRYGIVGFRCLRT